MRRQNLSTDHVVALLVAVLALVVTGCRGDVTVGASVEPDGTGAITLQLHMDRAMVTELDAIGVDLTAELEAVVAGDPDWSAERRAEDGGLQVELRRPVADVAEIGPSLRALDDGLAEGDPQLDIDVEVARGPDGSVRLDGTARFVPPGRPAATLDGEALGPDGDTLAALAAKAIDVAFVATLPGAIVDHDADVRDDRTLRWNLPLDEVVTLRAAAQPPSWWAATWAALPPAVWAVVALGVIALVALVTALVRRRSRAGAPG